MRAHVPTLNRDACACVVRRDMHDAIVHARRCASCAKASACTTASQSSHSKGNTMRSNKPALLIALIAVVVSGSALADGDGGDNGMSPFFTAIRGPPWRRTRPRRSRRCRRCRTAPMRRRRGTMHAFMRPPRRTAGARRWDGCFSMTTRRRTADRPCRGPSTRRVADRWRPGGSSARLRPNGGLHRTIVLWHTRPHR